MRNLIDRKENLELTNLESLNKKNEKWKKLIYKIEGKDKEEGKRKIEKIFRR